MKNGVRRELGWLEKNCLFINGEWMTPGAARERGILASDIQIPSSASISPPAPLSVTAVTPAKTPLQGLNKLERDFYDFMIKRPGQFRDVLIQPLGLRLANERCRYHPDFSAFMDVGAGPELCFLETKGAQFWDDAKVKLKVAAAQFHWWKFFLVTRLDDRNGFDCVQVRP